MKVNVDDFFKEFKKNVELSLKASSKVISEVAGQLYSKIVAATPIGDPSLWKYAAPSDYKPGTLRASWTFELNGNSIDPGAVLNLKDSDVITIANNQPYAYRVETGWSSQAPSGMMRTSILQFPQLINKYSSQYKL